MFKRIKNAVNQITSGHIFAEEVFEGDKTILRKSHIFSDDEKVMASYIEAPDPKFQYARPHFLCLNADEIQASNNQSSRPVIVPKKIFLMPLQAGYAECTNANKTEVNEDQASAFMLPLNSEHPSLQHVTYFGLFDGHDGPNASLLVSQNLHLIIKDNIQLVMDELERWMEEKDEKERNEDKENDVDGDDGENESKNNCSKAEKRKKSKKRNKLSSDNSDEEDEDNFEDADDHDNNDNDSSINNDNRLNTDNDNIINNDYNNGINNDNDIDLNGVNDSINDDKDDRFNNENDNSTNEERDKSNEKENDAKVELISAKSDESINSNKKVTSFEIQNEGKGIKDDAIKKDETNDIYEGNSNIEKETDETKDTEEEQDKNSNKLENYKNNDTKAEYSNEEIHNVKCDKIKSTNNKGVSCEDSATQTVPDLLVQSAFCKNCTHAEESCPNTPPSFDHLIVGALEVSFQQMDELLLEEMEGTKGGCAAIVVIIIADKIYVANAGDCRAVLYNNQHITQLSTDHTPHNDQHRIRMAAYMGQREELNSDLWTCNKFHKHPYHVDVGSPTLYQEPWMNGWFKKVLGREDIKSPLIYGKGKRSRLLQTIGLSRVLGDHNLRLYSSNILLKPLLSSVPQVSMVEIKRLFDEEQTIETYKERQRIKETSRQTDLKTDILNDENTETNKNENIKTDRDNDIDTNKDLTADVHDKEGVKKEEITSEELNTGIEECATNTSLNNTNNSDDIDGINIGGSTTTTSPTTDTNIASTTDITTTLIDTTAVTTPTTNTASTTNIPNNNTTTSTHSTFPTNHQQPTKETHPPFIILASDGLWDTVSNEEAVNCVLKSLSLTPSDNPKRFIIAAQDLVMKARVKSQEDSRTSLNNTSTTYHTSTNTTKPSNDTPTTNKSSETTVTTNNNTTTTSTTSTAKTKVVPGTVQSVSSPLKTIVKTDAEALEISVEVANDKGPQTRAVVNETRGKLQWSTIDDISIFVIPLYADMLIG